MTAVARFNKIVVLKIAVATAVMTGIVFGGYSLVTSPTFRIHSLDIELSQNASRGFNFDNIKDSLAVRLHPVLGQYTWNIDIAHVLRQIEKDRRIKDAKVRRILPDKLQITVTPHTPIANIMGNRSDRLYPLSMDGDLMPPVALADAIDNPILRGRNFLLDTDLRKQAVALISALPLDGALSARNVSEVQFDKRRGFVMTVAPSGASVWLGFDKFALHASRAQRVLDYLNERHLTGRIIDARLGKKVVVKLRNAP